MFLRDQLGKEQSRLSDRTDPVMRSLRNRCWARAWVKVRFWEGIEEHHYRGRRSISMFEIPVVSSERLVDVCWGLWRTVLQARANRLDCKWTQPPTFFGTQYLGKSYPNTLLPVGLASGSHIVQNAALLHSQCLWTCTRRFGRRAKRYWRNACLKGCPAQLWWAPPDPEKQGTREPLMSELDWAARFSETVEIEQFLQNSPSQHRIWIVWRASCTPVYSHWASWKPFGQHHR